MLLVDHVRERQTLRCRQKNRRITGNHQCVLGGL